MRVTKEKAAEHRGRMLEAASQLFRERGFDGVGIPEIARAADLTHGAFYTHFKSKEALCAEALGCAIEEKLKPLAGAGGEGALKTFVTYYLSEREVAGAAGGCPIAAFGGETARQPAEVRSAFERALKRFAAAIAPLFSSGATKRQRQRTLAATAMLVGGVILARAVSDEAYRREILDAVRHVALDLAE